MNEEEALRIAKAFQRSLKDGTAYYEVVSEEGVLGDEVDARVLANLLLKTWRDGYREGQGASNLPIHP